MSWYINVNRFSLHAVYRNRLIRGFLGSARETARRPDRFTGFDLADNLPMGALWPPQSARMGRCLFPVVNMALNIAAGSNLAWQERKAEAFAVTPLAAGNSRVKFRSTTLYGDRKGGITLGTAMAISGAAVSPNQGYHSSPLVSILMMLANVRLGWWLGNPKDDRTAPREGPRFSFVPILNELFGVTTDQGRYVYLSDGGHFENLGMYEMVRRRCRYIVVSDAGCDPDFQLGDLGNAVLSRTGGQTGTAYLYQAELPRYRAGGCSILCRLEPDVSARIDSRPVVYRIADGKLPRTRRLYRRSHLFGYQDSRARGN
jgi:hypothetical protein